MLFIKRNKKSSNPYHADFIKEYLHIEEGDRHAKEALDHATLAFFLLKGLVTTIAKLNVDSEIMEFSTNTISRMNQVLSDNKEKIKDIKSVEDEKKIGLEELDAAIAACIGKDDEEKHREDIGMLTTAKELLSKTIEKEMNWQDAVLIYRIIKVTLKGLEKEASDRSFLGGHGISSMGEKSHTF
jgi:hypothetical protein